MKYFTVKNFSIFLLLVAASFPIFLHLDSDFILIWDEGTYAVHAYEMYLNGNYLVKYYDGAPEMIATNPPLVCYFQVLCMYIFGPGELAVRMPSALAALGVVLLIIRFAIKEKIGLDFAFYAVLFLVTSQGYIGYHVVRNGDLDSVLIFFITGSIIYFYKFLEYEEYKLKYLFVFSTFILLGFFTKGIACLLVAPAFLIYALVKKKLFYVLKTKQVYYCFALILFLIVSYYALRELRTPGYISFMLGSEVGRWYTDDAMHSHPYWFYISWMNEKHFRYFLLAVPAFIICYFFLPKNNEYRKKSTIWLISLFTFFTVISLSKTKLEWYDAPLFPMLSIFMAFGLKAIVEFRNLSNCASILNKAVLIFLLFSFPYFIVIQSNLTLQKGWHDINFGRALKIYNKLENVPKKLEMLTVGHNGHAMFYKLLYNDKFHYDITLTVVGEKVVMLPNRVYLITHPGIIDYLRENFTYKTYLEENGMMVVKILSSLPTNLIHR